MSIRSWWREKQEASRRLRENAAQNTDQDLIGSQVPELLGMSEVEGMAHTLDQIREWRSTATTEQGLELQRRMKASQVSFEDQGLVMPYWGNLWVLRTYQAHLGLDAPWVAPATQ